MGFLFFIYRMGATDNIYKGQSTFMVELQVTLQCLQCDCNRKTGCEMSIMIGQE